MKNIIFVLQAKCAGAERMTLLYAKILQKYGYKCRLLIFSFDQTNDDLYSFIPDNIQYDIIRCNRSKIVLFYILKALFFYRIDIAFSSLPYFSFNLLCLKKILFHKLKVVVRLANMPSEHCKSDHENAIKYYQQSNAIIAQTNEMKEEIISYYNLLSDQIYTINNPTDKDLIIKSLDEPVEMDLNYKNYISCGQIIPRKNIEIQLLAFAKIIKTMPKSRLYILGTSQDEDYKLKLKEIVEKYKMNDFVYFMGFQSNPFKYINSADYFILSSITEGLPNVLLEAMYLGKPVISTTCIPYIKEIIQDGVNGITVPVGDIDKMAEAMIDIRNIHIKNKFVEVNNSEDKIIKLFKQL